MPFLDQSGHYNFYNHLIKGTNSPFQDINTCNDGMDVECLQRCVDDSDMCMTCEATRPILTANVNSQVDVMTFVTNIANQRLASGELLLLCVCVCVCVCVYGLVS